jgi:hypothetical protein
MKKHHLLLSNKLSFFIALLAFGASTFVACHKHDHDEDDTQAPGLTISSPAAAASLSGEVHISGSVTDASLHEMRIKVTRDSDGAELFSATPTVHNKTAYNFDEHWTPAGISAETAVTLTIHVEDHSANETEKTVKFSVK